MLAVPCLLVSMDAHVLNLAIPALSADLRPTNAQLLWIVDSYAFLVAGCLMTMGALGDRVGRRRLLLFGAAGFGAASLLAAFATSPGMLIAARVLLGITGATLMPSTLALIRGMFTDPRQRTTAFGVWTASFALGGVLAPVVAGMLLRHFWWGSVFLFGVPLIAVLLALGPVLLPELRERDAAAPRHRRRRAVPGRGAQRGLRAQASGPGRRRSGRRRRARDRALPRGGVPAPPAPAGRPVDRPRAVPAPRLLAAARRRTRCASSSSTARSSSPRSTSSSCSGSRRCEAGLWTIPSALGYLAGSALAPVAANRLRPAWTMTASLAVTAIGFGLLTQVGPQSGLPFVVAGSVIAAVGLAPVYVLTTELTVASAPPARSGTASGLLTTTANLGGALGIAFLGSLGGAIYRHGALSDPPTTDSARDAFTLAFRVVEGGGASLIAALAVVSALLLRENAPRAIRDRAA